MGMSLDGTERVNHREGNFHRQIQQPLRMTRSSSKLHFLCKLASSSAFDCGFLRRCG